MGKTKTCYKCKEKKPITKMTLIAVWICDECIKPNNALKKASKL
jgi:ribosomal protein L37AE/L43A